MSYSQFLPSARFMRANTKFFKWLSVVLVFLVLVHVYNKSISSPAIVSRFEIVPSSYNWSAWEPHHPIISPQPLPTAKPRTLPRIQSKVGRPPKFDVTLQEKRRQEVKATMQKAWNSYKKYAWMKDELRPITGGGKDTFGGWAATLVDSLDTLWIMDMKDEFYEAVEAAATLDWAKVQGTSCNLFETVIRYLGGLLSAYDLSGEPALLAKATELGDMLYAAFDTPNHLPPFWLDYQKAKTGQLVADDHQASASAASLTLEFTRLAQLTGKNKYYDVVARVTDYLYQYQNLTKLPGMWPTFFDLRNANFVQDDEFTLGALSDSMYEYLLKMTLLLAGTEPKYEQLYRATSQTIIDSLLFRPMTPDNSDILFSGTYYASRNPPLSPEGQHLGCFAGGMFAIGGKIFNMPEHVEIGARLTKGCMWAYSAFSTGLAPEIFGLVQCDSMAGCEWDEQKWRDALNNDKDGKSSLPKGFRNARDPRYILRPEALESVFILYRITGDESYREAAWTMFQSIQKATDTVYGNAAIVDMTVLGKPEQTDSMESFWCAETLKYLYLTFSPREIISLDDYVFNTEAHPMKIPKG